VLKYSIINNLYKVNNQKKIEFFKMQFKKKDSFRIKIIFKNYIVNKSSFKYKKSREQYAISIIKKKWTAVDKTIIPKIF
jgi:hypothetical protein